LKVIGGNSSLPDSMPVFPDLALEIALTAGGLSKTE
jgi:hypothetical protein